VFCRWLVRERGFVHVDTDHDWPTWGPLLTSPGIDSAVALRNRISALGSSVAVEWGMRMEYLPRVRQLRSVGFDPWWFDGDERAARQGWIQAHPSLDVRIYENQRDAIAANSARVRRTFGACITDTVSVGPTYLTAAEIAKRVLDQSIE
jgi:hypothetical protein